MVLARTALPRVSSLPVRTVAASSAIVPARMLHSSRAVRDAHDASAQSEEQEHYPSEGFGAPIWRWTFLGVLAAGGLYRYTSTHTTHAAAPASDDELEGEPDDDKPFLTRYITYHVTKPSIWKERSDRHLDAVRQRAEDRLLFQDAERPPIHRLRFPGSLDCASPGRIPVGESVDMSDVKVKRASS